MSAEAPLSRNKLGLGMATLMVAGNLIGSGIYLLPATLATIGSISIFGWIIAALGALVLAGVFSLMISVHPTEDGLADIARVGLGDYWGFQSSLLYWLGCWLANIAIALAVTGYLTVLVPVLQGPVGTALTTVAVIWALTVMAIVGPRMIGRFHGLTMAIGLIPLLAAGTLGWLWFDPELFARSWNVSGQSGSQAVFGSLLSVFWAFVGVECAAMVARLVEKPERNVPIATMGGVGIAAIVYMFSSTAIFGMLSAEAVAASSAPFALAVDRILGPAAAGLVAICAVLKASGTLGGWVLVGGETTRWTAVSGFLPRWLAKQGKGGTPVRALLAMAVVMSLAVFLTSAPTIGEQFELLINASVVFTLLIYIYVSIVLVRMTSGSTPARRWTALALAILAIAFCVLLIASSGSGLLTVTAGLIALTIPAWLLVRRQQPEMPGSA